MEKRKRDSAEQIFDPLREKYVALTPEERVRQRVIEWLMIKGEWPKLLMMSETEINIGEVKFRCDIVCYNKALEPQIIVECKAPEVKITEKTFEQIWRYALILKVRWIMVTNGTETYVCLYNSEEAKYEFIKEMPKYLAEEKR